MKLNFSWRQKLNALMWCAPLGLAVILGGVMWGLSTVSSSYRAIYEVVDYEVTSNDLLIQWSAAERLAAQMEVSDVAGVRQQIDDLELDADKLIEQSHVLDDDSVINSAAVIAGEVEQYAVLRQAWLEDVTALGLSNGDGLRQEMQAALADLKSLSIAVLDEPVDELIRASRQFVETSDSQYASDVGAAVTRLDGLVSDYDWQDNVIGQNLASYKEVFSTLQGLVTSVAAKERQIREVGDRLQKAVLDQNERLENGLIQSTMGAAENAEGSARVVSIGAAVVFAVVLMLALVMISRTLVRRLESVSGLLLKVSAGDLTHKLALGRNPRDEFNALGQAANQMIDDVAGLLRESTRATEAVLDVRAELAQTTERLNRSSESIDQQTEQAATATQEISVTINDVARRTAEVGNTVQGTNEAAKSGEQTIRKSVETMHRLAGLIRDSHGHVESLNRAGSQVTGIIDVIDGLAEQTNLLALNAAIEAARAGEAGRGFSVVADEVRSLAQKTVDATTNISALIGELNQATVSMDRQMEAGHVAAGESAGQANEISDTIARIVTSVEQLTAEMDQVVVAVQQISFTTEDIAQKVDAVREQTGEAREISRALDRQSELLSGHANRLEAVNRRFRIDEDAGEVS